MWNTEEATAGDRSKLQHACCSPCRRETGHTLEAHLQPDVDVSEINLYTSCLRKLVIYSRLPSSIDGSIPIFSNTIKNRITTTELSLNIFTKKIPSNELFLFPLLLHIPYSDAISSLPVLLYNCSNGPHPNCLFSFQALPHWNSPVIPFQYNKARGHYISQALKSP